MPGAPPRQARGTTQATMLRELADLIDALAMTRPLVLVLEDLHWSDTSTVEALAMIARRRAATSLLMIGTYRPGDLRLRGHPLKAARDELRGHGHCVEMALGPLEGTAVRTYVARRTAGVSPSPAVAAFIQRRSHGHPLFMATLTDYLIERGVLMDHAREDSAGLTALTSDVPTGCKRSSRASSSV